MTTKAEWLALAERCAKATGSDRDIERGMGEGTRSGLWSEIVRLVGELRPQFVIVENVAALLAGPSERRGGWFGRVLGDLAECGYDAEWENIPASALGARHRRERIWLVAYPGEIRRHAGRAEQERLTGGFFDKRDRYSGLVAEVKKNPEFFDPIDDDEHDDEHDAECGLTCAGE